VVFKLKAGDSGLETVCLQKGTDPHKIMMQMWADIIICVCTR